MIASNMALTYPTWICWDCGTTHGAARVGWMSTYHIDTCGWCGKEANCTEPRDFGYPPMPKVRLI